MSSITGDEHTRFLRSSDGGNETWLPASARTLDVILSEAKNP